MDGIARNPKLVTRLQRLSRTAPQVEQVRRSGRGMRAVFQDDQRVGGGGGGRGGGGGGGGWGGGGGGGGGGVARTVAVRRFLRVTRIVKTTDSADFSDR